MIKNIQSSVNLFTWSVWDRVNYFHSNPYSAVFRICHQNNIDNTPMFQLSLSGAWTTSGPQFATLFPEAQRLEACWWARDWEGAQLSQTDQRDNPYHIRSCSAMKGVGASFFPKLALLTGLLDTSLLLWSGEWLITFASLGIRLVCFLSLIKLSLYEPMRFYHFCPSDSFLQPTETDWVQA